MRRHSILASATACLLALGAMVLAFAVLTSPAAAAPGDVVADRVLGQGGSFLAQACNNGGVSATSLCTPDGVAVDSNGNVYVAELNNNRVLEYDNPLGSCGTCDMIADRVFGQGGSFTSSACNLGGITASSLCQAADVAVDSSDNVYVVDFGNNRVLEYLNPIGTDTIADRVFGQGGSFTSGTFTTSPTANTLTNPISVAVDATDHVYIGDRGMHRVLEYDPPNSNTTANRVFGQFGSFITGTFNNGGPSADSLGDFNGIGVDAAGNLYVADSNNARALEYDTPISTDTTADIVFGQFGSYSSTTPDNGGVTADSLETPTDIGADAAGNVYITDTGTERTLEYDNPVGLGTSADVVYGQGGSFTSFGNNNGGLSASSQADPWAIAFDHDCNLFIADYGNNRALEYDQPPHACANAGTATPTSTLCPVSACTATPTITDTPTITPTPTGCIPNPVQGCPTPTPTCSTAPCSSPTATPTCNASTGAICATATPCISPTGAVCTPTATSTPTSTPTCTPSSGVPCPTPTVTPCVPASGAVCTPTATSTATPTPTCTPSSGVPCPTPTATPCTSSSGAICTATPTSTPTVAPVLCGGLVATIVGTNGTDLILGTAGNDIIAGLSGNDVIIGMGGNDIICGGPGDDVIYGNAGADRLFGDTGNDVIFGGAGTDKMDGGPGFDFCDGGPPAFGDVQVNCELVTGVP